MVLRLILLRHLKSSWDDPSLDDFDRPLAKRGKKAGKLMKERLKDLVKGSEATGPAIKPDLILCSAAVRTKQTLEEVAEFKALKDVPMTFDKNIYEATRDAIADSVKSHASASQRTIMVIGHNPGMEEFALWLIGDGTGSNEDALKRLKEKVPTGALAVLASDVEDWKQALAKQGGNWRLESFVTPKELGGDDD